MPATVVEKGIGGRGADFTAFSIHLFPQVRLPSQTFHEVAEDLETVRARGREETAFGDLATTAEERCGTIKAAGAVSGAPFFVTAVTAIALPQVIRETAGLVKTTPSQATYVRRSSRTRSSSRPPDPVPSCDASFL